MYELLGNKIPRGMVAKKLVLEDTNLENLTNEKYLNFAQDIINNDIFYSASATREHLFALREKEDSKEKEVIFAFNISKSKSKSIDTKKVRIYGDYSSDIWLQILGIVDNDADFKLCPTFKLVDTKVKRVSEFPQYKYVDLSQGTGSTGLNLSSGGIEDYLYENRPLNELFSDFDKDTKKYIPKDMSWLKNKDYRILIKRDEILDWIDGLSKTEEIVGFDTETSGLRVNRTKRDILVGLCMSYEDNAGIYIPVAHERMENSEIPVDELIELLRPYLDVNSPLAKDLVTHNGKFDWSVMKMHDIELNIVYDTFIRESIHNVGLAKTVRNLKGMAKKRLGIDVIEIPEMYVKRTKDELAEVSELIRKGAYVNPITAYKFEAGVEDFNDLIDFRYASREFTEIYGPADADFPRLIHKLMDEELPLDEQKDLQFTYNLEINTIPPVAEQEYYGVRVDKQGFLDLNTQALIKKAKLETEIYELAGGEFNINSSSQKSEVLFDRLNIPVKPRYISKKTKLPGTGKAVLKDLKAISTGERDSNGKLIPKYPIVAKLSDYTKNEKLISSFYSKLPKLVTDDYIFPNYQTVLVETGRLSCSKPNIQQTEANSRGYMLADTDDHYLLICDYSQAEYRIMAGLSGEQKVINFFNNNPEADYHILAYANMMGKNYEDVTPAERSMGKILNFGTTYGLEDQNLALNLYGKDDAINQQLAREARDKYFAGVPILRDYFESVRDKAQLTGYTETWFKRKRRIPEFHDFNGNLLPPQVIDRNSYKKGSGRRKAGNMPVQGTAADITKIAMTRVRSNFRKYGFFEDKARLVLNVHDEICCSIHKSVHPWLATAIMREAMEINLHNLGVNGGEKNFHPEGDGIPNMYVGANVGYTWLDGKVDELEAPVILMDRMCKWAMDKFLKGEELPYVERPREYWLDMVSKFNAEVVHSEVIKGNDIKEVDELNIETIIGNTPINTVSDALKNVRLAKYVHSFDPHSSLVIKECINQKDNPNFFEDLHERIDWYYGYNSPLAKKMISDSIEIKEKENLDTLGKLKSNIEVFNNLEYFGEYSGTIGGLINDGLSAEEIYTILKTENEINDHIKNKTLDKVMDIIIDNAINSLHEFESKLDVEDRKGLSKEVLEVLITKGTDKATKELEKSLLTPIKWSVPKVKEVGGEVEDDTKTLENLVKKSIYRDTRVPRGIIFDLGEDNHIIYNAIDDLLVEDKSRLTTDFPKDKYMNLSIKFASGELYNKEGYSLPDSLGKYLRQMAREHFLGNEDNIVAIQKNAVDDLNSHRLTTEVIEQYRIVSDRLVYDNVVGYIMEAYAENKLTGNFDELVFRRIYKEDIHLTDERMEEWALFLNIRGNKSKHAEFNHKDLGKKFISSFKKTYGVVPQVLEGFNKVCRVNDKVIEQDNIIEFKYKEYLK